MTNHPTHPKGPVVTTTDFGDEFDELDAYHNGLDQLAWDQPNPEQPLHTHDQHGEPVDYLQHTYRGEPAWCCGNCLRITLGDDPAACRGCGDADNLTPYLYGPVQCRTVGGYDGPCLVGEADSCHCPEGAAR